MEKTKYSDIVNALDSDIMANILQPGHKLLSITRLSRHYNVSKNTIIRALHILESKDKIEARPKSGFFVKHQVKREQPSAPSFSNIEPSRVQVPELFQDIMLRGAAFDIMPGEALAPPMRCLASYTEILIEQFVRKPRKKPCIMMSRLACMHYVKN